MNNVIKAFLFSLSIATVSVQSGEKSEAKVPNTVTVGDRELPVQYDSEGKPYVVNNGTKILIQSSSSNRPYCVSPVSFSAIKVNS